MSEQKEYNQWTQPYRLIVLKEDTLEKVRSQHFRLRPLIIYGIIAFIGIMLITSTIIAFTPVKRLIPGYAEITENRVYIDMLNRVQELEKKSEDQALYITKLSNLLTGEHQSYEQHFDGDENLSQKIGSLVKRIEEDDSLREKVTIRSSASLSLPGQNAENYNEEGIMERVLIPPVRGILSASYTKAEGHLGVDILAPAETPVKSIDQGVIIAADWTMETGYTIGIQHKDNLISYYKHNSSLLKDIGQSVEAGEAIAIIGNTGHLTSGPHLHFELWYDGNALDPADYINFEK